VSGGQTRALLSLRWRMVRSPRLRVGLAVLGVLALAVLVFGVVGGAGAPLGEVSTSDVSATEFLDGALPPDRTGEVGALLPAAMLAFVLLCVVAPIAAGGGYELLPESTLVAFPVRVSTLVRASLVLSPLNLAWFLQVAVLSTATAYAVRGPGGPGLPLAVLLAFLAACTTLGQALGWIVVGVRRGRRGRVLLWLALATTLAAGAWIVVSGRAGALLDAAPTVSVRSAQRSAADLQTGGWLPFTAALLAAAGVGYLLAVRAASWALRRPSDLGVEGPGARRMRRRPPVDDDLRALVRVDRASVWRSPPLRRGLLVLGLLPVTAALVASLPWSSIALLPPLVASGAALLFGVNAMALDGTGAVWVATLPHDQTLVLRAKARVLLDVVAGAVGIVVLGAAVRASGAPHLLDLVCAAGSAVSCTLLVVATCLHLSVTRPHRAELTGVRDTPAPPGAMAVYSARLAGVTTLVGLLFCVATYGDNVLAPLLLTAVAVAWAAWSWHRTRTRWVREPVRAHVIAAVASG
jgi:hypothetical protein